MDTQEQKNKQGSTTKATQKPELQSFFFPGGMEYKPVNINAASIEEAQVEWEKVHEKIEAPENLQDNLKENE